MGCQGSGDDILADFTNYGPHVDVVAPGHCITTTVAGDYVIASGTSYAAPIVAGAAARMIVLNQIPASPLRNTIVTALLLRHWTVPATSECGYTDTAGRHYPMLSIGECGTAAPVDLPASTPVATLSSPTFAAGRISWQPPTSTEILATVVVGVTADSELRLLATVEPGDTTADVLVGDATKVKVGFVTPSGDVAYTPTIDMSVTFADIATSPHAADIEWAAASGITLGCSETRYCPHDPVTRGQMAAFLVRALNLPAGTAPFTDIAGSGFDAEIGALATRRITTGYEDGTFRPNDPVTRGQMAAFLVRALGLMQHRSTFSDTAGHPFAFDIGGLATAGITNGCDTNRYCPDEAVTRAQMATFLRRALDR